MWNPYGLMHAENTELARYILQQWEKSTVINVLREIEVAPRPNPIQLVRLIFEANQHSETVEIYEYNTTMSLDQIEEAFKTNIFNITKKIRIEGIEVYTSKSKHENDR